MVWPPQAANTEMRAKASKRCFIVKVLTIVKLTLRAFVFENGCIVAVLLEMYKLLRSWQRIVFRLPETDTGSFR